MCLFLSNYVFRSPALMYKQSLKFNSLCNSDVVEKNAGGECVH